MKILRGYFEVVDVVVKLSLICEVESEDVAREFDLSMKKFHV